MKDIYDPSEAHCINGTESIASIVGDNFYDARPTEPGQHFCVSVLVAPLRDIERVTHMILNLIGKAA